jgi:hypothetical protein
MTNFWAVLKIFIRLLRVSAENLLRLSLTDPFSGRVPNLTPQISRPYSFEASEGHEILARAEGSPCCSYKSRRDWKTMGHMGEDG